MPEIEGGTATPAEPPKETEPVIALPKHVKDWDKYFLGIAKVVATKSKDPKCAVGAVIVSRDNVVLSTGFNGLPRGVEDSLEILEDVPEKIKVICHAEQNAVVNAARIGVTLQGASIFVTKFPCLACCNVIIQAGILRIYTEDHKFWDDDPLDSDHSRKISLIRQTHIVVDAPNHPEYSSKQEVIQQNLGYMSNLKKKATKS